ncbi:MAG: bifunctional oligoribonuclease/PAP phosphatase NrnA [Planctomycetaceae bacterium]
MSIDWEPLREIFESHERFVLSSHVRPDADAIGSELALAGLLERRGKSVRIVNPSDIPGNLSFLDPARRIMKLGVGISEEEAADTDVHVILDTSAWAQLLGVGKLLKKTKAVKVLIDHHLSSDNIGALEFKDVTAEATGSLVFEMAEALGYEIAPEAVVPLFCAIATDTGWFRFSSTKSRTMRIVGHLIDLGARPNVIYEQLYENYSLPRIHLAGRVLSRATLDSTGKIAYTWVQLSDFVATGATPVDTEDLVNECLRITGTECAFIAIEQPNQRVKISFRSRTDLNVAAVAEKFGGGGHKQAAGAVLPGQLDTATTAVLLELNAALSRTEPGHAQGDGVLGEHRPAAPKPI